jgi:hypothetical protein
MKKPLDLERFRALVAAYGARPERFPDGEREAALTLLATSEEARDLARAEAALDSVFLQAPAGELSPGLARRLAEVPIRHARPERRPRLVALWTALGWSAAAAFGVLWGARSEAVDGASAEHAAETTSVANGSNEPYGLDETGEELVELALGAVVPLEEEP